MADRWLRNYTIPQLFKLTMINYPTVLVSSGFYFAGIGFGLHAHYMQRHVVNDSFKRYKYKQVVMRPDSPYIKWLFQRDTEAELEEFKRDLVPYPNKWNTFKSFDGYGIDVTPKELATQAA